MSIALQILLLLIGGAVLYRAMVFIGRQLLRLFTKDGHVTGPLPWLWKVCFRFVPAPLRTFVKRSISYPSLNGTVAVIRASNGDGYLLAHHTYPVGRPGEFWGLPGGAMERNEPPPAALARELENELNLKPITGDLLVIDTSEEHLLDFVYECDFTHWDPRKSPEVDARQYFRLDRLPQEVSQRHALILQIIDLHRRLGREFPVYYGHNGLVFDRRGQKCYLIDIRNREIVSFIELDAPEQHAVPSEVCAFCASRMVKSEVEYALPEVDPLIRTAKPVPGYRCGSCEAEYYPVTVTKELLEKSLPILKARNRDDLATSTERRIANLREEMERQGQLEVGEEWQGDVARAGRRASKGDSHTWTAQRRSG